MRASALVVVWATVAAQNLGVPNHTTTDDCEALKAELDKLWIDQTAMKNGIVGGAPTETDCRKLHDINMMDYRSNDEQGALCGNPCYNNTAQTYANMLNLDCFKGIDEYETANQRLFAASFQYGCQQNAKSKYCVPLVGEAIQKAGSQYDMSPANKMIKAGILTFEKMGFL
ncbi:hypothetical protein Ae201684P_005007 [Aphanomyces euteiches]|uniref:Secreted protein n=1 Tax=Aphanomyces euteiches TaxID=100861 RepID=A0A6G0X409_9STRA|nr:hypothetical protein Ae201684_008807 [Aphanomyces euteiches]KAH9085297.1 hypothetical protein Ae201684P_005007 [Aphanomyces euteiches]KAH9157498.1 hypothetical protein AeRB84_000655 [Aphanomyces euteiches]